ncbi:MAG: SpoIVB peptidase [Tyzzerella sp.]|nr:SpoIVB peptidase [Tyzzerella sp.]
MRKRWYRRFLIMSMLLVSILGTGLSIEQIQTETEKQQVSTGSVSNDMVIPGGMPIGIYMKTDGVLVLGTDCIEGKDGQEYEPAQRLVKDGDYIIGINGEEVSSKKDLVSKVEALDSENVVLQIRREEEEINVKIKAVQAANGDYKLGIWVRDSVQGLGTVTFITEDNQFGALGHGIHDTDTDELLEIEEGRVYETKILRIEKGEKGSPGGMEGMIVYNRYNILGSIEENTDIGVFGTLKNTDSLIEDATAVPVCAKSDVKTGAAVLRCCVEGEVKEYDIEIQKINHFTLETNKGMVIKVVDEKLLEITGGIVQGMSGSPILQNGKLVGAVTHVLVNDPTKGYGIFIEDMIKQ